MNIQTIYIAPGNSQCRVYAIPYPMRPGQHPRDISPDYQGTWKEIGLLNSQLRLVYLEPAYAHLAQDIEGQGGGTCFGTELPATEQRDDISV